MSVRHIASIVLGVAAGTALFAACDDPPRVRFGNQSSTPLIVLDRSAVALLGVPIRLEDKNDGGVISTVVRPLRWPDGNGCSTDELGSLHDVLTGLEGSLAVTNVMARSPAGWVVTNSGNRRQLALRFVSTGTSAGVVASDRLSAGFKSKQLSVRLNAVAEGGYVGLLSARSTCLLNLAARTPWATHVVTGLGFGYGVETDVSLRDVEAGSSGGAGPVTVSASVATRELVVRGVVAGGAAKRTEVPPDVLKKLHASPDAAASTVEEYLLALGERVEKAVFVTAYLTEVPLSAKSRCTLTASRTLVENRSSVLGSCRLEAGKRYRVRIDGDASVEPSERTPTYGCGECATFRSHGSLRVGGIKVPWRLGEVDLSKESGRGDSVAISGEVDLPAELVKESAEVEVEVTKARFEFYSPCSGCRSSYPAVSDKQVRTSVRVSVELIQL